jgi:hypothetical protein
VRPCPAFTHRVRGGDEPLLDQGVRDAGGLETLDMWSDWHPRLSFGLTRRASLQSDTAVDASDPHLRGRPRVASRQHRSVGRRGDEHHDRAEAPDDGVPELRVRARPSRPVLEEREEPYPATVQTIVRTLPSQTSPRRNPKR